MSKIIGIDLGTTYSLVAIVDSGIPMVLADLEGHRLTPSVVHYPADGSVPLVGYAARNLRAIRPRETIYSIKRFIGRERASLQPEELQVAYPLDAGTVRVPLGDRLLTPEEISAEVLRKLKAVAEQALGEPVSRAVITVPAYFAEGQRRATLKAAELAGLTVERILNEPTAAALAYGLDRIKENARIAVYDLGGGTFDISILELRQGCFEVLSTHGNTRLGGDDLDQRVMDHLAEQVRAAGGPDAKNDLPLQARLREEAEKAKIKLSQELEVEIALPFLRHQFSVSCQLTREQLESLTMDLIARTRAHCLQALQDAQLKPAELNQVILVGGQTRMPLVRRCVAEWFQCAEFEEDRGGLRLGTAPHPSPGPRLNTSQNPDEAVALGAAIQAEILSGGFQNLLLLDVTPLSLGLETFGGLMNVIIPRNSTIPVKAGELFTTAVDFQRQMLIHVLQGERDRAADNFSLGRFALDFPPAPRGVPRVGVQFEIDANGILHVLARDTQTSQERRVDFKSAVDVEDAKVQHMVEESVAHAFEDLRARQWIEVRLRAQEILAATEKGLNECGTELPPAARERVDEALAGVNTILLSTDPVLQTGDPVRLKAACAQLDEATRPLADLLMDKAMDAMLRKRGVLS